MDENQSTDNDLQKAIDNINNNNSDNNTEPAFSEPVAAPSSVPEGDSGELGEPVGPFPMPPAPNGGEPSVNVVEPGPEPIAPIDPINIPDLGENGNANVTPATENNNNTPIVPGGDTAVAPNVPEADNTTPSISTDHNTNLTDSGNNGPDSSINTSNSLSSDAGIGNNNGTNSDSSIGNDAGVSNDSGIGNDTSIGSDSGVGGPAAEGPEIGGSELGGSEIGGSENHQIKEAALKALIPLLKDHVKASPEEKFELCKDIFDNLHDSSVFDQAYQAASEITDEDARAQALLYIIESIE